MRLTPVLLLLPALLTAEPTLKSAPAKELAFPTEPGTLYQLQVKSGDTWMNVGTAVRGTGQPITSLQPAGDYRLTTPKKEWVLVWADEFESDDLDYTKWAKEENNYGGGNNERQAYRTDPKYCYVKDGKLHLAAYRDPHTTSDGKTQPYSSARLRTMNRGEWTFGKIEFRAKVPDGEGIWPAVWMLPTNSRYGGWAASGEIDLLESRGNAVGETTGALHFGGLWPRNTFVAGAYTFPGKNAAEDFHLYALEWSKDKITWSVDGVAWQTRTKDEWFSEAAKDNPSAPFDQPFHLLINLAVDGRFFEETSQKADHLPASAFPQVFQLDYVRVYQWAE